MGWDPREGIFLSLGLIVSSLLAVAPLMKNKLIVSSLLTVATWMQNKVLYSNACSFACVYRIGKLA